MLENDDGTPAARFRDASKMLDARIRAAESCQLRGIGHRVAGIEKRLRGIETDQLDVFGRRRIELLTKEPRQVPRAQVRQGSQFVDRVLPRRIRCHHIDHCAKSRTRGRGPLSDGENCDCPPGRWRKTTRSCATRRAISAP